MTLFSPSLRDIRPLKAELFKAAHSTDILICFRPKVWYMRKPILTLGTLFTSFFPLIRVGNASNLFFSSSTHFHIRRDVQPPSTPTAYQLEHTAVSEDHQKRGFRCKFNFMILPRKKRTLLHHFRTKTHLLMEL